jgi:UDP-glucose 4-epimerase
MDLCEAHLLALNYLYTKNTSQQYNVGNGQGYSVQQVIDTTSQVTGKTIKYLDAPRRAGDPAKLIADATRIQQELSWKPAYPELATIIQHAWQWEQCKLAE